MRHLLFLACLSACVVISGCASPTRIIDGRYYDPSGSYSFATPVAMYDKSMTEKKLDQNRDFVSFQDPFGHLVRFEITKFPHDEILAISDKPEELEKLLELIFKDCVLAAISQQYPNVKISQQNIENIEGIGTAYFAIINIPNGSTLIDLNHNQRLDSKRGYLLSFCENHLVVISNQESSLAEFAEQHCDVKVDRVKKMYDELVNSRLSYKITN